MSYGGGVVDVRSPLALAALATAAVPGLDIVALRPPHFVDDDYSTAGLLAADGRKWTVMCPRTDQAGARLIGQVAALHALGREFDADRIPFEVPRPIGAATVDGGGRAVVYPTIPGRRLTEDELKDTGPLAKSLARSLAALHSLSPRVVTTTGLPSYTAEECRSRLEENLNEANTSGHLPPVLVQRWRQALDDDRLWQFRTVPVHADFSVESLQVEDETIVAITGFGDMRVADPAEDLTWLLAICGDDFLADFWAHYERARPETDAMIRYRADLLSELELVRWLLFGLHSNDQAIVEDAKGMLADLAEEVDSDLAVSFDDSEDEALADELFGAEVEDNPTELRIFDEIEPVAAAEITAVAEPAEQPEPASPADPTPEFESASVPTPAPTPQSAPDPELPARELSPWSADVASPPKPWHDDAPEIPAPNPAWIRTSSLAESEDAED